MDNLKIVETNWGVANRFDNEIEVNKNLSKYPELYKVVIEHELNHDNSFFSMKDFKHDVMPNINLFAVLKFMIRHPSSLTQFIPFYYNKQRGFVYDINLILIYALSFGLLGGVSYTLWRII